MLRLKRRRRRRAKRKGRIGWFRRLAGELLNVCLGVGHGRRAGYRVARILRAKIDRRRREVVLVVVRLYGGDEAANGGFNGRILRLEDRREFVGDSCLGVVRGRSTIPIDAYCASLLCRGNYPDAPPVFDVRDRPPGAGADRPADLGAAMIKCPDAVPDSCRRRRRRRGDQGRKGRTGSTSCRGLKGSRSAHAAGQPDVGEPGLFSSCAAVGAAGGS